MVEACIARNPTKKGIKKLRLALGGDVTLSLLEDGFLALLRGHDLELPRMNIEADVARGRRSHHIACTYGDVFERAQPTAAEVAKLIYSSSTKAAGGSA